MKVLKQAFSFYLNSSIHVALSVYALAFITLKEFGVSYDENVLYFIFYATITGYNFVKYFGIAKWHHRQLAKRLQAIQLFSFICFLLMCYYMIQLEYHVLLSLTVLGGLTFLYAIPVLPKRYYLDKQQNLRDISGLKVYIIGLVWAGVTVLLPLLNNKIPITADVYLTLIQRFAFVIVLMIPFEIRDLAFDNLKLSTIPQKIGVNNAKIIALLLLVVVFLLEFFKNQISVKAVAVQLLVLVVTGVFVVFSTKEKKRFYSAFWVEGIPVFWLLAFLFSEFFV